MRFALLIILGACSGAEKDSGRPHYSDCDDSCEGTDSDTGDTGAATPGFEVCDDGVDNDENGDVDEVGCVSAWAVGDTTAEQLGKSLVVALDAPTFWAYSGEDVEENDVIGGLVMDSTPELQPLWALSPEPRYQSQQAAVLLLERRLLAYTTGTRDVGYSIAFAEVPGLDAEGASPTLVASIGAECDGFRGLDAWVVDDGLDVAVGPQCGFVFLAHDVGAESGQLADRADTTFSLGDAAEGAECFGCAVAFVPDAGGDGIADLAVGAPGAAEYSVGSAVYIFDGMLRGNVTAADADAVISAERATGYGERIKRLGDVDGDGYDDLAVTYSYLGVDVWFGPFEGELDSDELYSVGGLAIAGEFSADGDETSDLAVAGNDGAIHLFSGPIQRASLDYEDADYTIPTPAIEWSIRSQLIFADADGNGTKELVVGHPDYGMDGTDPGPGLIAVFDLSEW